MMRVENAKGRVRLYRDGVLVLDVTDRVGAALAFDRTVDERVRRALKGEAV